MEVSTLTVRMTAGTVLSHTAGSLCRYIAPRSPRGPSSIFQPATLPAKGQNRPRPQAVQKLPYVPPRALAVIGILSNLADSFAVEFLRLIRRKTGIDVRTESCAVFDRHIKRRTFYNDVNKRHEPSKKDVIGSGQDESQDASQDESRDENPDENQGLSEKQERDRQESCSSEASLEHPAVYSSRRRGRPIALSLSDVDEDDRSVKELGWSSVDRESEPEHEFALPPPQPVPRRMSVLSTPSPSIPASSLPRSSPLSRRARYTPYSVSPPRFGGTGPPPEHWGPNGKPPPTPCFVAPSFLGNAHEAARETAHASAREPASHAGNASSLSSVEPSLYSGSSMPSTAPRVSYFFASASPEPVSQLESESSRRTAELPAMPVTSAPPAAARAPAMSTLRFGARRQPNLSSFHQALPLQQQRPPSRAERRLPPPPSPPVTPVRNEPADVEFVLSMSASPNTTGPRTGSSSLGTRRRVAAPPPPPAAAATASASAGIQLYAGQGRWQPAFAPAVTAAHRPLGVTPARGLHARLGRPGSGRPDSARRGAHIPSSRTSTLTPVIDLTAPSSSSSSAFIRRPHPMPIVTSNMGRRPGEHTTSSTLHPQQQSQLQQRRRMIRDFRPAAPGSSRRGPSFPDLQSYRFEV